ncbi:MAG: MFS transporter [Alphaproteobacteria bacterium]|nr:MAG: MFS transporter [Alphaproteobacteria bacterium]
MQIQKILPILYIGLFTVFDPIAFDFLATALPLIANDLRATPGNLTGMISYYLLGVGFAQLWSGEFVDRYGQRISVRIGAVLFLLFGALVAFTQDLYLWYAARFVMGMAVGLCITAALSLVRENYAEDGGKILSIIYGAGNFVGVIAPLLAGLLISYYGWHSVLWAIASWGIVLVYVAFLLFPHSTVPAPQPFSWHYWIDAYKHILSVNEYIIWALLSAFSYGAFLAFITGSSYVFAEGYGIGSTVYSYMYSLVILVFVVGSFMAERFEANDKLLRVLKYCTIALCLGSAAIIANALSVQNFYILVLMILVMSFTTAILIPHGMALALLPFEENKGKASAGIIIMHVIVGSAVGWGVTIGHHPYGMMIGIGMLLQALAIYWLLGRVKRMPVA